MLRTALMFQNLTQFYHGLYYFFVILSFNQSISQTNIQWWFLNMAWGDQYGHKKGVAETDLVEGEGQ